MKRDMDLVRRTLLVLERREPGDTSPVTANEVGAGEDVLLAHLDLLQEAGLIDGNPVQSARDGARRTIAWNTMRLTWAGHDFIAAAVNDTVWNAAKRHAGELFKSLSLPTLSALLQLMVRSHIPGL